MGDGGKCLKGQVYSSTREYVRVAFDEHVDVFDLVNNLEGTWR